METNVQFASDDLTLVGKYRSSDTQTGVVITHPHPQYGGEMHNPVVEAIARAYQNCGLATLRFNFRGVGMSTGRFDEGRGETHDVLAALAYLKDQGIPKPALAGYSFGARINANIDARTADLDHMLMVAPPVAFMPFDAAASLPALELVLAGEQDEFGPAGMVASLAAQWNPRARVEILAGADHFLFGHLDQITAIIKTFLKGR